MMGNQNPRPVETTTEPAAVETADAVQPVQDAAEQLDAEEAEFRALRRDLAGVKGASAAGIVAISVGKTPTKNEFFRTHKNFGRSSRSSTSRSEWRSNTSPSPPTWSRL